MGRSLSLCARALRQTSSLLFLSAVFLSLFLLSRRLRRSPIHPNPSKAWPLPFPRAFPLPTGAQLRAQTTALLAANPHLTANPMSKTPVLMFRMLGNDLPPRHIKGQTIRNVRFILQHEAVLPNVSTRWYLNRIVDPAMELQLVQLLITHRQCFSIDRLNLTSFAAVDFQLSSPYHPDVLRSSVFRDVPSGTTQRNVATSILLEPKTRFLVRNNPARNAMLRLARQARANYLLPWDGNCFLTESSWSPILTTLSHSPSHLIVPMARMLTEADAQALLTPGHIPKTRNDEPQIIFHANSSEGFDESLPYGQAPKLTLLIKLKAAPRAGWVARLPSGNPHLEGRNTAFARGTARMRGLWNLAVSTHLLLAARNHFSWQRAALYDEDTLSTLMMQSRRGMLDSSQRHIVQRLGRIATRLGTLDNNASRHVQLQRIAQDVPVLALAGLLVDQKFLREATARITTWTRGLDVEGVSTSKTQMAIAMGARLCPLFDALRWLERIGTLDKDIAQRTRQWARMLAHAWENDKVTRMKYFSVGEHAVAIEAVTACAGIHAQDFGAVLHATAFARGRLLHNRKGGEVGVRELQHWMVVATVGRRVGVDVWGFRGAGMPKPVLRRWCEDVSARMKKEEVVARRTVAVAGRVYGYNMPAWQSGMDEIAWRSLEEDGRDNHLLPPFWRLAAFAPRMPGGAF